MNVTSIFVTHDQVEAMTLGDRLAVINEGVIEQLGTPLDIYERPESIFVGEFIGSPQMNFVNGTVNNNTFESKGFKINIDKKIDTTDAVLGFRAEHLQLKTDGEISLTIDIIEKLGADSIIYGKDKNGVTICYKENGNTKLNIGDNINLSISVDSVHLFDKNTGKRIN